MYRLSWVIGRAKVRKCAVITQAHSFSYGCCPMNYATRARCQQALGYERRVANCAVWRALEQPKLNLWYGTLRCSPLLRAAKLQRHYSSLAILSTPKTNTGLAHLLSLMSA